MRVFLLFAAGLCLASCAVPAADKPIVSAARVASNPKYVNSITIDSVAGDADSIPFFLPDVNNPTFKSFIEDRLMKAGYLAQNGSGKYRLSVLFTKFDRPLLGGLDLTSTTAVEYRLTLGGMTQKFNIETSGTANMADSVAFLRRFQLANTRAADKNFAEFLSKLATQ